MGVLWDKVRFDLWHRKARTLLAVLSIGGGWIAILLVPLLLITALLVARRWQAAVFAALIDPDTGMCAKRARFGHAHVVEKVAANPR